MDLDDRKRVCAKCAHGACDQFNSVDEYHEFLRVDPWASGICPMFVMDQHALPGDCPEYGPGSELERLLEYFATITEDCGCADRICQMNRWGPAKCRQRIETILNWLQESAAERKLPFVRAGAAMLVRRACSLAERNIARGLIPVQFSRALIAYCPWLAAKPEAAAGLKRWNRLNRRQITKHAEEIVLWVVDVAEKSQLPFSSSNARIVVDCAIARLA